MRERERERGCERVCEKEGGEIEKGEREGKMRAARERRESGKRAAREQ